MLLAMVCYSIWTSYAFKLQLIEIAIVNVFSLLATVVYLSIYLLVKTEQKYIVQFFVVLISCQVFNFDVMHEKLCGILGLISMFTLQIIPLSQIVSLQKFA